MGSKTQTSTSSTSPTNPALLGDYQSLIGQAQTVASTPYQGFTGPLTAGLNGGQNQAIGELEGSFGAANPYINAGSAAAGNAQTYAGAAAGLANPNATAAYMDPYLGSAVAATRANIDQSNAEQQQGLAGQAIGAGAFGGDRAGIAASSLARQQGLAEDQTISGMENQGYQQATAARQADAGIYGNLANSADQNAQIYGGLGSLAQSSAIQGASAGLQGATLQQQTDQAADTAAYGQWQNARAYPFQTTGWLGNIMEGIGTQEGATTVGTQPGPSGLSQATGAATAGLGILGASGAFGSAGWLTSDERAKDDIEPIGKTFDGQTIHRWTYKGDPSKTTHTGLIAQEVEKRTPDAVRDIGGLKRVEYGAATDDAAERGRFANGGGLGALGHHSAHRGGLGAVMDMHSGHGSSDRDLPAGFSAKDGTKFRSLAQAAAYGAGDPPKGVDPQTEGWDRTAAAVALARRINGSRGAYADGGEIPDFLSPATTASTPASLDAGSGVDASMFSPSSLMSGSGASGSGLNMSPSGLAGGGPFNTAPLATPRPLQPSAMPQGLGVVSTPVQALPASGLGAAGSSGSPAGLGAVSDPSNKDLWMGVMAAGLGMMGGTSPFAGVNIGNGALKGLQEYQGLQQNDRANALAQGELAVKQQQAANDTAYRNADLGLKTSEYQNSLVTMQPVQFGPNGQGPGYMITDRRDPDNPIMRYQPLAGMTGASAPTAQAGGVPTMSGGMAPSAAAAPGTAALSSANAAQTMLSPTDAAALPASDPRSPDASATTSVPNGYQPPNAFNSQFLSQKARDNLADIGSKQLETIQNQAASASQAQMQVQEMTDGMKNLPSTGILAPGQFASERLDFAKSANTLASTFGLQPMFDQNQVADAEALRKDTFRLGTQLMTNQNGGREAGFILQNSVKNTAGIDNTPQGFQKIAAAYGAAGQYAQDRASFASDYYGKFGSLNGMDQAFQQLNPWQRYAAQAIRNGNAPIQQGQDAGGGGGQAGVGQGQASTAVPSGGNLLGSGQQPQALGRNLGRSGPPASAQPPVTGARQAPDGNWYVPDPNRSGKYLRVDS